MAGRKTAAKNKKSMKRQMLVYLPPETITALKIAAVEDGGSVSAIVEELANAWLERRRTRADRKAKPE